MDEGEDDLSINLPSALPPLIRRKRDWCHGWYRRAFVTACVRVCVRGRVLMHASGVQYLLLSYAGREWGETHTVLFFFNLGVCGRSLYSQGVGLHAACLCACFRKCVVLNLSHHLPPGNTRWRYTSDTLNARDSSWQQRERPPLICDTRATEVQASVYLTL